MLLRIKDDYIVDCKQTRKNTSENKQKYRSLNYRNDLRVNHDTITILKAPQKTN